MNADELSALLSENFALDVEVIQGFNCNEIRVRIRNINTGHDVLTTSAFLPDPEHQ